MPVSSTSVHSIQREFMSLQSSTARLCKTCIVMRCS